MNQPLSKEIVDELKELGVVTGTRSAATDFFGVGCDSYLRSLHSKQKDASVEAYFNCYVMLEDLYRNTNKAAQEATDPVSKAEFEDGANVVNALSEKVWNHLLQVVRDKQK